MFSLLAILSIVGTAIFIRISFVTESISLSLLCFFGSVFFFLLSVLLVIGVFMIIYEIGTTTRTVEKKIKMYEEENEKIEAQMDDIVKTYMTHERETLVNVKPESAITLATVYPELKSNELIQKQIQMHINNSEKLKNLRLEQIGIASKKWLVNFKK